MGFPKLTNFLFFELSEIEKIGFEWQWVFIEPSGTSPGGGEGGRNQKDLTGGRFQVTVPLFDESKVSF